MDKKTIQEWRGVKGLVAAELTTDTLEEYACGTPFSVAGVAELSRTTESSSETHFYDNAPGVIVDATGGDEVTLSVSAIPFDVLAKITGQHYNEEKGMFVEGERESKYFALGYITEKTDGTVVYVWRLKGKFSIPDDAHKTKDDGTEANGQEIVYTGISTIHVFKERNKPEKAAHLDTSVNTSMSETAFFAEVQTPDTITSTSV